MPNIPYNSGMKIGNNANGIADLHILVTYATVIYRNVMIDINP